MSRSFYPMRQGIPQRRVKESIQEDQLPLGYNLRRGRGRIPIEDIEANIYLRERLRSKESVPITQYVLELRVCTRNGYNIRGESTILSAPFAFPNTIQPGEEFRLGEDETVKIDKVVPKVRKGLTLLVADYDLPYISEDLNPRQFIKEVKKLERRINKHLRKAA